METLRKDFQLWYPELSLESIKTLEKGSTNSLFLVEASQKLWLWKTSTHADREVCVYQSADTQLKPHLFHYYPSPLAVAHNYSLLQFEEGFQTAWELLIEQKITLSDAMMMGIKLLRVFHQQGFLPDHGDFHLGQFGQTVEGREIIFDFEGQPFDQANELNWQWADLAGLIRSLDYYERVEGDKCKEMKPQLLSCRISSALGLYLDRNPKKSEVKLLGQALLRRAKYEVNYEQKHRPEMAWVPQAGYQELVELIRSNKAY